MKLKKQQFNCDTCQVGIELTYPKCSRCGKQMRLEGDNFKFYDHVKIHQLRRSHLYDEYEDRRYYVFTLGIGPILINGMTYNASNGSVMFPSRDVRGTKTRVAKGRGAAMIKIRELVKHQISVLEGDESEEEERVAA